MTDEISDLQSRIQQAKQKSLPDEVPAKSADSSSTNSGIRAATDLIGTPIVCGGLGMLIDDHFATGPIFFILLGFLGVITGFYNIYKMNAGNDSSVGFKRLQNKEKDANKAQLSGNDLDK